MKDRAKFGRFGGCFVPEILMPALEELERHFYLAQKDESFLEKLNYLLKHYAGRPTPLYLCQNLNKDFSSRIFLKREDLLHGGAHKTNQVIAQGLLAKGMGKKRIIAETGAGQHGVATSLMGALFSFDTCIYMGKKDVERQRLNVFRMQLLGAKVISVDSGDQTLKDAVNEALRDWALNFSHTHYVIGSVVGPHPFPQLVREFQRVIGKEAREQFLSLNSRLPDAVIACVGGGSNSLGIFADFIEDKTVRLIGVEGGGEGVNTKKHAATLYAGTEGILHGARTKILQDEDGQVIESHSVSAGLDYPAVGPEHAHLQDIKRAEYVSVTDDEALSAFVELSKKEGIIPAFESAHALAYALKLARANKEGLDIIVNISGRGDKDMEMARDLLKDQIKPVSSIGVKK